MFNNPQPIDLGSANDFAILSKAGITTTGTTNIIGNVGTSPISSTALTGFGLVMDSSNTFSKSPLVVGNVYAANYESPTPAMLTQTVEDMQSAYIDATSRASDVTELNAGNLNGQTLTQGVYKWSTPVTISENITLSGDQNSVFIFQIAGTLSIASAKQIILQGVQAKNIFRQVSDVVNLSSTSVFNGIILAKTAVTMENGAVLNGSALAQTNITLIGNTITKC